MTFVCSWRVARLGGAVGAALVVLVGCIPSRSVQTVTPRAQVIPSVRPCHRLDCQPAPAARFVQPLRVPASLPVILFHDPVNYDQIDGVTWDGTSTGLVAPTGGRSGVQSNPDGSLYASLGHQAIYDRSGQLVDLNPSFGQNGVAWADDGRHYCWKPGGTLILGTVGAQSRDVAQLDGEVAACSVERDQAIVFGGSSSGNLTLSAVRLSTGRVLWTRPYPGMAESRFFDNVAIVASHDGQYIAENICCDAVATVLSADGSSQVQVPGWITQFSWDGSLVVVSVPRLGHVSVIRWRDGRVLWTADTATDACTGVPGPINTVNAFPEPSGPHIAVAIGTGAGEPVCGYNYVRRDDVYVVGPDGRSAEVLKTSTVAFPICLILCDAVLFPLPPVERLAPRLSE